MAVMANDPDNTREHGIEFGELVGDLKGESYPLSHRTLLDRYGDYELDLVGERVTLRGVLMTEQEREYENSESIRQAVFNMVGEEAIGRKQYSDRGGSSPDIADSTETESF